MTTHRELQQSHEIIFIPPSKYANYLYLAAMICAFKLNLHNFPYEFQICAPITMEKSGKLISNHVCIIEARMVVGLDRLSVGDSIHLLTQPRI